MNQWRVVAGSLSNTQRRVLAGLSKRLKQQLRAAFHNMTEHAREKKHLDLCLQKAVHRSAHNELAGAFRWWCDDMLRIKNSDWKARSLAQKLTKRKLTAAWSTWVALARRGKEVASHVACMHKTIQSHQAKQLMHTLAEQVRAFNSVQVGLGQLRQHELNRGWNTWSEAALEMHLTNLRVSRTEARLKQICAARAFDFLRTKLQERSAILAQLEWAERRMDKRARAFHFHIWLYGCQTRRERAQKQTQEHLRIQHAVRWMWTCRQRWMVRDMRQRAAVQCAAKHCMQRALSFADKMTSRRSLQGWLGKSQKITRQKSCGQLGQLHMLKTSKKSSMRLWVRVNKDKTSKLNGRECAINYLLDKQRTAVLRLWGRVHRAGVRKEKKLRSERGIELLIAESEKVVYMTRLRAWRHMSACARSWKEDLVRSVKGVEHSVGFKRAQAMAHWHGQQMVYLGKVVAADKATRHMLHRTRQVALATWTDWSAALTGRLSLHTRAMDKYLQMAKSRGLCDFLSLTKSRRKFADSRPVGVRGDCRRLLRKFHRWSLTASAHAVKSMENATRKYEYFRRCHAAVTFWQWRERTQDRLVEFDRIKTATVVLGKQGRAISFWRWRALAADFRATELYFIG